MLWRLRSTSLDCSRPLVVGILNATPDSFASIGRELDPQRAADHALGMVQAGAAMLDIGAESTRPGAPAVPADEQIARLTPVLHALRERGLLSRVPVSIDTSSSVVARALLQLGAECINDVSGGTADEGMLPLVAQHACGFVIMHRVREPSRDVYSDALPAPLLTGDSVPHVVESLRTLRDCAVRAGVPARCIALDPGLGFGKTVAQNLALIRATRQIAELGHVVMSGLSRKSFVGRVGLERDSSPDERLAPTLAFSLWHAREGAHLLRVHDVAEHVAALRVLRAETAPQDL